MPSWSEVLKEIQGVKQDGPLDLIRREYLLKLSDYTERNCIAYYSGWLQRNSTNTSINDEDKNGFMNAIHGLDRSKGLDLILHTPGGNLAATESLVHYLRQMFNTDIRAIVPQISMSAGTMIACSCKKIIMGKQSNLGPIDPQFNGIPAQGVIEEFRNAIYAAKNDKAQLAVWRMIISQYHPTFIGECQNAIVMSKDMVKDWLSTGMFKNSRRKDLTSFIDNIVKELSDHSATKTHSRHLHLEEVKKLGLKIFEMEKDEKLQDLILTVHHAFMHTLGNTPTVKIIENHEGKATVLSDRPVKK
jgi:ClpP class serine protease